MAMNEAFQNCPYCGGTLEKGALRSRGGVYFLPENSKVPTFYTEKPLRKANAIPFPPFPLDLEIRFPEAYVCRKCHVLVMEYEGDW